MLASYDYHFPKSPPTSRGTRQVGFCVGAHGADGSGWLPAESPSAANHLADGEDTLLSARLPGFSTARKRPGAAATVFLQPMAEEPIGTFRNRLTALLQKGRHGGGSKPKANSLLVSGRKRRDSPSDSLSDKPASVMSEDQAASKWGMYVSVRMYARLCPGVHE